MDIRTFVLLCLITISSSAHAQWTLMNSGTNEDIEDLYFLNETNGYGITPGSIIVTTDGGFNWSVIHTFESHSFPELSIVTTPNSVFAFGQDVNGDPFKLTAAHGSSDFIQTPMDLLTREPLYFNGDIYYVNYHTQASRLMRYNNGDPVQLATGVELFSTHGEYLSFSTAWFLYTSNDHGISWDTLQFHEPFLTTNPFQSFYNGSDTLHATTHYPSVLHTSHDAGLTWQSMDIPFASLYYFQDPLRIIGPQHFGASGIHVISTIDGGHTWHTDTLEHPVRHAYLHDQDITFIYGANGVIYRSGDPWLTLSAPALERPAEGIRIKPNPAHDRITIELPEGATFTSAEIIDMKGNIARRYAPPALTFDVQGISAGTYTLVAQTSAGRMTAVMVLE